MRGNEDGTFTFVNLVTMQALDVSGGIAEEGNPVDLADENGTDAQKFYLIPAEAVDHPDDGNYTIAGVLSESGRAAVLPGRVGASAVEFHLQRVWLVPRGK